MTERVLVIGSGSQARYVLDIATSRSDLQIIGIADIESKDQVGKKVNGVPIVCTVDEIPSRYSPADCHLIIGYGQGRRKQEIAAHLGRRGFHFISAISPHAVVSPSARLGKGCIINPGVVILPNATLGHHVVLHANCVVEHDNQLADFVNLAPAVALAGRVQIDEGAVLYTGAKVIPGIHIGAWSEVAAGAVVTKDVKAGSRVAGVPAKPLRKGRARG